jgi:MFS transporter, FHS family, L-fucose permease
MKTYTNTQWASFLPLISVFFFWGFVAASNDILIPVFKQNFNLSQTQSQYVSVAFYVAYTVGSIIYLFISYFLGKDIVRKLGYKNSLAIGLFISAFGTLLFYPAANTNSFALMLSGLFIVGLGFSLQQTVANPLAISLGPKNTGSQRLTMAGGINNLGTTIGPLIVSFAIFGNNSSNENIDISTVKVPYLVLGAAFTIVAVLLLLSKIPNHLNIEEESIAQTTTIRKSALHYPQLYLGMLAIFLYVGVEVSTISNLPAYLESNYKMTISQTAPYVALYWASLMIGRWSGAAEILTKNLSRQKLFKLILPYTAFAVFLLASYLAKKDLQPFYIYALVILVLIFADIISKGSPSKMLIIFSLFGIVGIAIGMLTDGMMSLYAFISVGLFCSTLWPCIFTLAIAGLGKHTTQGSSFLIMMIMGGGLVSWLQGYLADTVNIKFSYIVGIACFAYLIIYGLFAQKTLKKQGILFEETADIAH